MSADQENAAAASSATQTPPAGETPSQEAPKGAAAAASPEGESTETPAQNRDEKGRFKNPVQPRIDELTRKTRESEREAAYWRGRYEAATAKPEPKVEKPRAEDFEKYDDYVEALTDWKSAEKIKASEEAREKRDAETRQANERQSSWEKRVSDASTRIPDFVQVMSESDVPVMPHVWDLLQEADRGPEVMHAMAKDPALAEKLNAMTPTRAGIEIGRLEAALPAISATPDPAPDARTDEPAARAETPPARKTSSAPPPVKPAPKGASAQVDLAKLPMDEYVKKRAADGATWARR